MRPRLRLWGGLRGRLLLALVLTSMVTLGAAAAVVLSPLQQRLRDQSIESLRAAVLAARPRFEDALKQRGLNRELALGTEAFELSDQTAGRVLVTDLALTPADDDESPPGFLADSESGPPPRQAFLAAVRTINRQETVLDVRGDDVAIGVPLYSEGGVVGVVVARRRLTEVANAVKEVRRALLAAAGVGLLVAVALAVALASTLLRRLGRLRAAALRISAEGPTVSMPRDAGHDEVGDLARALGGMQEELRRQESARRAFVATASHELRTPLTMLQGTMELLEEDLHDGPSRPHRRAAPGRDRAARAAAALDPGRGAARPLAPRRRGGDALRGGRARRAGARGGGGVRAAGGRARDRARGGAAGRRVLGARRPRRGRARRADPDRQRAALRRRRADPRDRGRGRRHGHRRGRRPRAGHPARGARADLRALLPRPRRGSEGGFGLGLAIGRELAERMGGSVTLADRPGGGTRFVLSLPRSPGGGMGAAEHAPDQDAVSAGS